MSAFKTLRTEIFHLQLWLIHFGCATQQQQDSSTIFRGERKNDIK